MQTTPQEEAGILRSQIEQLERNIEVARKRLEDLESSQDK
jgi:hypothetical protein